MSESKLIEVKLTVRLYSESHAGALSEVERRLEGEHKRNRSQDPYALMIVKSDCSNVDTR